MPKSEIMCIVPARGGSKGIPRKNVKQLNGVPLLGYTATAALGSRFITRSILSTEDHEIAAIGREYGLEVPFMRPAHLADDDAPSLEVFQYTLIEMELRWGYVPDLVIILQPTSPFRTSAHIDEAIEQFINSEADSLVSIVKIPHNMSPFSAMQKDLRGYLHPLMDLDKQQYQRQNKPSYFARNGAAIYITTPWTIVEENSLFGKRIIGYEMEKVASIDIDDLDDWLIAEAVLALSAR